MATVSPLARDPAIQAAIGDQITAKVFTHLDVQGLTTQAVQALSERGLPPRVATQLEAFADAWVQANRVAHAELVKALTGEGGGAVTVRTTR